MDLYVYTFMHRLVLGIIRGEPIKTMEKRPQRLVTPWTIYVDIGVQGYTYRTYDPTTLFSFISIALPLIPNTINRLIRLQIHTQCIIEVIFISTTTTGTVVSRRSVKTHWSVILIAIKAYLRPLRIVSVIFCTQCHHHTLSTLHRPITAWTQKCSLLLSLVAASSTICQPAMVERKLLSSSIFHRKISHRNERIF